MSFPIRGVVVLHILNKIRQIAADPHKVFFSDHAINERMQQRDVGYADIRYCLLTGEDIDDIREGEFGDPVYRVVGTCTEGRPLKVAVAMTKDETLMVVTVIRY